MSPERDDPSTIVDPAEAERAEHPDSFDPGTETGYLRRGHRDHDLDVDSGAAPFDPGPDHYDDRRARRISKKAEKAERKRREREQKERAARERAEAEAREKQESARRDRAERERRAAEEAERAERDRAERDEELKAQRERAHEAEAEKAERAHAERERLRREEQERAERDRAERKRAKQAERERRDAELQAERDRIASERAERDRAERQRARGRRPPSSEEPGPGGTAVATRPKTKPKLKPSERLKLADMNLKPAGTPSREPAPPRLTDEPAHVSLRLPTVKVGAALLLVTAAAALAGSAAGLPVPGLGGDSPAEPGDTAVDAASLALLDAGTPVGLSKGPYHPVVGDEIGYGEQLAKFGAPRGGRRHEGQDVFATPGTPLVSIRDGVVVDESSENGQYSGGRGNYVVVYSQLDGRSYVYLHMLKPSLVEKGDIVEAGQPLGQVGCTGYCDGPHLHFEVRNGRQTLTAETKAVDPLPLLKQWPSVPVPAQG